MGKNKNKEVNIQLGAHALNPFITPTDISDDLFTIECSINEEELKR